MSNLVEHAKTELKAAGLFDKDSDYDGMLGEAALELVEVFAKQGHSGLSAPYVADIVNKLFMFQPSRGIMTVSAEQWEKIDTKYNGLFWAISHRISGDKALASLEDNFADLQIVALEAVAGFEKKTGRKFDEFWGEKLFDQYIKTCLWNFKNNKGARIAQRYNINRDVVSTSQNEEVLKLESNDGPHFDFEFFLEDISAQVSEEQKAVVEALVRCPSCVKQNGTINISKVAKKVGMGWQVTADIVKSLDEVLSP